MEFVVCVVCVVCSAESNRLQSCDALTGTGCCHAGSHRIDLEFELSLFCRCESLSQVYGYVTSSDVKIIALLERDGIIPLKKRKEVDIKIMFTAIHNCYVKYTMNPFSEIRDKIEAPCSQFEKRLQAAMNQYNCAVNGN
mmetsp:Transcript_2807/g.7572  ORF Transcript_2807/g.7572 Transcript_2807/m.7572 type:complete len:139 (-) Transcript_2807:2860-3276(-)